MSEPDTATASVTLPESDAELIARLRSGDNTAYETLWQRHVGAALRLGRRIAPGDAADLVSEAFLAVYDRIRVQGAGPDTHFRAYLFTTMRNMAVRMHAARNRIELDPDIEVVDERDPLLLLLDEDDARLLLRSFRSLPVRWQRVLWLSEVAGVARPAIARELRIRPNAVSALHRRAKAGLRTTWMLEHLPPALRGDPTHAASRLPDLLLGELSPPAAEHVHAHLRACTPCAQAHDQLRAALRSARTRSLGALGFAALAIVLPTASALTPAATATAAVVAVAALVSAALLSGGVALTAPAPGAAGPETLVSRAQDQPGPSVPTPHAAPPSAAAAAPLAPAAEVARPPAAEVPPEGDLDLWQPAAGGAGGRPQMPAPTPAAPGSLPVPATTGTAPGDGEPAPTTPRATAPAVTTVALGAPYLAPRLSGVTDPAAVVAIDVAGTTYAVDPGADGAWQFDLRMLSLDAGAYLASIWTVQDGAASGTSTVTFTTAQPGVAGFPDDVVLDLDAASSAGITFTVTGPPSGDVCVWSDTGQSAVIPLGENGTTTRRIRFLTTGVYALEIAVCAEGVPGPAVAQAFWVSSGVFDPWDEEPVFEIDAPSL